MSTLLSPIKDIHSERRLFIGRVVLSAVIAMLLLGIVVARLVQLQVFDHELFAEKSQGNRVRIEPVPPIRGLVFDRKGRVIAENLPAYQLELIPEQVEDIDDTLGRLAAINLIEFEDIPRFKELSRSGPRFKPVTLKFRLTEEEIANFARCSPRSWLCRRFECRGSEAPRRVQLRGHVSHGQDRRREQLRIGPAWGHWLSPPDNERARPPGAQ
jgi:penicillin-binding protein 2